MPTLLELSRELAAMSQAGLAYTKDPFDKERFTQLHRIASQLLQISVDSPEAKWPQELGYPTPKIDVRGAIFQNDKVLLAKERSSNKWTLPGGWADVNNTLRENVERECVEETGYHVVARSIISILDMERAGYPRQASSIYKIYLLCDIIGGAAIPTLECSNASFYSLDDLPDLDLHRCSKEEILRAYHQFLNPQQPTYFN